MPTGSETLSDDFVTKATRLLKPVVMRLRRYDGVTERWYITGPDLTNDNEWNRVVQEFGITIIVAAMATLGFDEEISADAYFAKGRGF